MRGEGLAGPYIIKVDVQGAELQVLAGAQRTLNETEAVILEVTLLGMMIGGPQVYDVVSRMKELGFVTYDVFGLHYRPLDNALSQVDMVFVQEPIPANTCLCHAGAAAGAIFERRAVGVAGGERGRG
jgi:Methyltransferase FkbM domain